MRMNNLGFVYVSLMLSALALLDVQASVDDNLQTLRLTYGMDRLVCLEDVSENIDGIRSNTNFLPLVTSVSNRFSDTFLAFGNVYTNTADRGLLVLAGCDCGSSDYLSMLERLQSLLAAGRIEREVYLFAEMAAGTPMDDYLVRYYDSPAVRSRLETARAIPALSGRLPFYNKIATGEALDRLIEVGDKTRPIGFTYSGQESDILFAGTNCVRAAMLAVLNGRSADSFLTIADVTNRWAAVRSLPSYSAFKGYVATNGLFVITNDRYFGVTQAEKALILCAVRDIPASSVAVFWAGVSNLVNRNYISSNYLVLQSCTLP